MKSLLVKLTDLSCTVANVGLDIDCLAKGHLFLKGFFLQLVSDYLSRKLKKINKSIA